MSPSERAALLGLRELVKKNGPAVAIIDMLLSGPELSDGARRQREFRKRHPSGKRDVTRDVTSNATDNVTRDDTNNATGDVTGGSGGDSPSGSHPLSSEQDPKESRLSTDDDGVFGMTGSAWAEGISMSTGVACTPPRGRALTSFWDAVRAHAPAGKDRVAWCRDSAKRYAARRVGRHDVADVFAWIRWLNGGCPEPFGERPGAKQVQPEPEGGRAWKTREEKVKANVGE